MNRVVLGILTTHPDGASCRTPRQPQWRPLAELIRAGQQNGVMAYIFSPGGIDWVRGRVVGFHCLPSKDGPPRWRKGIFPLPDIVYNRVPTRIAEGRPAVQRTLRHFRTALGRPVFNPHYLNKSGVARVLLAHPPMQAHVPATAPFRDGRQLAPFLRRHRIVYIKSVGGSLGNDLMRLAPGRDGGWTLHYNAGPFRTRRVNYADWDHLLAWIRHFTRGRPYIMQQGIRLARIAGRPFDLRLLVQKLPSGRWHFTGGAARVAGRGQITTHVPRGGRRLPLMTALERAFGSDGAPARAAEIARLATDAATVLDIRLGRTFAEMSLDVGVDDTGHPWIFEMNAKPLHFDEADIQRRRNEHLLNYAKAVAQRNAG